MNIRQIFAMLLFYCGIGLWLGSLVFFGFGVAGVLFHNLLSKDLAGAINGIILHRLNIMEYISGGLILCGLILFNFKQRGILPKISILFVLAMLCLTYTYSEHFTPAMNDLKSHIHSFDTPIPTDSEFITQFQNYHHWYSRLVGINLGLGAVLFIWQTFLFQSSLLKNLLSMKIMNEE